MKDFYRKSRIFPFLAAMLIWGMVPLAGFAFGIIPIIVAAYVYLYSLLVMAGIYVLSKASGNER